LKRSEGIRIKIKIKKNRNWEPWAFLNLHLNQRGAS